MPSKPFLILGTPPLTGTDKRSYVATLAAQDNPKLSVCDVFNDLDISILLAVAPELLAALYVARNDIRTVMSSADVPEWLRAELAMTLKDIGTLLATIPAKFCGLPK